jgi:exodeoxyribonuclease-5
MDLSYEQQKAISEIKKWLKTEKQVFRLFGYAGTGKTTLVKEIAKQCENPIYACFTGKAASVLRAKGCRGARTIHSLIYEKVPQKTGVKKPKLTFQVRSTSDCSDITNSDLVILDECSMVDEQMGKDILSFGKKTLVLGDPAQLSPHTGYGFFINTNPDILLEDIFRQSADSPILTMATIVRNGQILTEGEYGSDCRVIRKSELSSDMVLNFDTILVGRNKTRQSINKRIRELKGFTSLYPSEGDTLVCTQNDQTRCLLNGSIFTVLSVIAENEKAISLKITLKDGGIITYIILDKALFNDDKLSYADGAKFDYGYALTVHKSQGSQWDNVLLFDESHCFNEEGRKWLYTGITRAAKTITIVKG